MADLLGLKHQGDRVRTVRYTKGMGYVNTPETWTTFDGVQKYIHLLDHQHLSNIIHFMTYVAPNYYTASIEIKMRKELKRRFKGELLPWRPLRRFKGEMDYLLKKGYLHYNPTSKKTIIIIDGKIIGEVEED